MEYKITYLFDTGNGVQNEGIQKTVLAIVPFDSQSENTALQRAYDIAELIAHKLFSAQHTAIREIKGQLYPMYFADTETGNTINVE